MSYCRICRTENNLKYSIKELRHIFKKQTNNAKVFKATTELQIAAGNICLDCEERLHNYNKLTDDDSAIDCANSAREDSPVIVDDDELLYNLFFQKQTTPNCNQTQQQQEEQLKPRRELTQHSLGSDSDVEIVEIVISSRESTPCRQQQQPQDFVPHITASVATTANNNNCSSNTQIIDLVLDDEPLETCAAQQLPTVQRNRKRYSDSEINLVASLSLVSSDSETELEALTKPEVVATVATANEPQATTLEECAFCSASFGLTQRLVHHMRVKHRSSADTQLLSERPKCPQDSAMTIRLRYQQRYSYYECQLCGQIDAVFKQHKQHILQAHADESKSLRDPMMQSLKCPLCKYKCGQQPLKLCKHLRNEHKDKHAPHLRAVEHVHPFGWSAERQQDVERTARVFQMFARKVRYFECNICENLTNGYFNHWKHLQTHAEVLRSTKPKPPEQQPEKQHKKKLKKPAPQMDKTKPNKLSKHLKKTKHVKHKEPPPKVTSNTTLKAAKSVKQKQQEKQQKKMLKQKVKTVLRPSAPLAFVCKYCGKKLKGFMRINLHLMRTHAQEEQAAAALSCCTRQSVKLRLAKNGKIDCRHTKQSRRKCYTRTTTTTETAKALINQENHLAAEATANLRLAADNAAANIWLQDLMTFTAFKSLKSATHQCKYCTQLFASNNLLLAHVQQHVEHQEFQIIKYAHFNKAYADDAPTH